MAPLAILLKGFARTSETFITRELEELEARGLSFTLVSLRDPQGPPQPNRIQAPVAYLPEYLHHAPWTVIKSWLRARKLAGYEKAKTAFLTDLRRDFSRNRIRRFGQALVIANKLAAGTRHLHAHFIHTPASVARYTALLRTLTFSVSAHAKDIWLSPAWDLKQKTDEASFIVVCHDRGRQALLTAAAPGLAPKVHLIPHGLSAAAPSPGAAPRAPGLTLLTVARAVPKKGLNLVLQALALLPQDGSWRWTHIGGGPELNALRRAVEQHPARAQITLLGPQPHAKVLAEMRAAGIFVLGLCRAADGDEDGRPNVVLEAMQAGLPVICPRAGSVEELIESGVSGLLTRPGDPDALAQALSQVMGDAKLRERLGAHAKRKAADLEAEGRAGYDRLCKLLQNTLEGRP